METLQALYTGVSRGGFIIVDYYILPACRQAVDNFREQQGIKEPLSRRGCGGRLLEADLIHR